MGPSRFGFPELKLIEIQEGKDEFGEIKGLKYICEAAKPPSKCPHCHAVGTPYAHGSKIREIKDLPYADKPVVWGLKVNRYLCRECGQTFVEQFESVVYGQMTKRLRDKIAQRVLRRDTFSKIARDYSVSDKTVRRIFDDWAAAHAYMLRYDTPRILGIDEAHIDDEFRLVVTDIEKKMPLDMLPNNKFQTVVKYLKSLPNKNNVQAVTMDFFEGYANAVERSFPFAPKIIIDRFHVIQLLNNRLDTVRKRTQEVIMKQDDKEARRLKKSRKTFQANLDDISTDGIETLSKWFSRCPELETAYMLKEQFREIYTLPSRMYAEEAFDAWCEAIPDQLPEFVSLRQTFTERREHILNYFDFPFTNAFTESANNIIKDVEKRGRGYDFEVLRMVVLLSFRAPKQEKFKPDELEFEPSYKY